MCTHGLFSTDNIQHPSPWYNLRNVSKLHRLLAVSRSAQMHPQALYNLWIELAAASQLAQIMGEPLNGLQNLRFQA